MAKVKQKKKPPVKKQPVAVEKVDNIALLSSLIVLNKNINTLDEAQCGQLLLIERAGRKRVEVMRRLYGRFNILRTERERRELFSL